MAYASDGITVEGSVRGLLAHEESGYEESGASLAVCVDPGPDGRGLSLALAPTWSDATSRSNRLWSLTDGGSLAPDGQLDPGHRLDVEVGCGLGVPHGLGVVTPYAGLGLADARSWPPAAVLS